MANGELESGVVDAPMAVVYADAKLSRLSSPKSPMEGRSAELVKVYRPVHYGDDARRGAPGVQKAKNYLVGCARDLVGTGITPP